MPFPERGTGLAGSRSITEAKMADLSALRRDMVAHQIQERGVRSAAVARAMREVPREEFMSEEMREFAYADSPLPIGEGQTISQPYIVAYMTQALELEGRERVLEVGTGSGYAAAVLAHTAGEVYTIERHPSLARSARATLERLGYRNVHVIAGDGTRGYPQAAPYDAIVVAAGGNEVSPGTSEFYRMRARITQRLIELKGFDMVAVEADWPDAGRIDHYVRHRDAPPAPWRAFSRFPEWMWRNREVEEFVEWLHRYNMNRPYGERVAFHGLDLYSLYTSINAVLRYLDDIDPEAARVARSRYGCLTPWESDPATYGRMALTGGYEECERDVTAMLSDMLRSRAEYSARDGER